MFVCCCLGIVWACFPLLTIQVYSGCAKIWTEGRPPTEGGGQNPGERPRWLDKPPIGNTAQVILILHQIQKQNLFAFFVCSYLILLQALFNKLWWRRLSTPTPTRCSSLMPSGSSRPLTPLPHLLDLAFSVLPIHFTLKRIRICIENICSFIITNKEVPVRYSFVP